MVISRLTYPPQGSPLINPSIDLSQELLTIRRTGVGSQGLEFGSKDATGGASYWDFHTDSGDGDYRSRIIRNTGTNGTFSLLNTGTGYVDVVSPGGVRIERNNVDSTVNGNDTLFVKQSLTTTAANPAGVTVVRPIFAQSFYSADDVTDALKVIGNTISAYSWYSTNDGVNPASPAAKGSWNNISSVMDIFGSGSTDSETSNYFGYTRARNGAQNSIWFTDFSIQGPVDVQPAFLNGITMIVNNYYDPGVGAVGSRPYKSAVCNLVTMPNTGGGMMAPWDTEQTYKMEIGLAIVGRSGKLDGSVIDTGFDIALQIGGVASGWMGTTAVSRINKGLTFNDIITTGIEFLEPVTTNTGTAIKMNNATRAWDIFIDLSTGLTPNTAAVKIGTRKIRGATIDIDDDNGKFFRIRPIATTTFSGIKLAPSVDITTVADTALRSTFRQYNVEGANEEYVEVSANGTNGFFIQAAKAGSGSYRDIRFRNNNASLLFIKADGTIDFNGTTVNNMGPTEYNNYLDYTKISAPSDPGAEVGRLYFKTIDANNNGLFVKLKKDGVIVESQVPV